MLDYRRPSAGKTPAIYLDWSWDPPELEAPSHWLPEDLEREKKKAFIFEQSSLFFPPRSRPEIHHI